MPGPRRWVYWTAEPSGALISSSLQPARRAVICGWKTVLHAMLPHTEQDRPSRLALKLQAFVRLAAEQLAQLGRLQRRDRRFEACAERLHETKVAARTSILQDGWAVSYTLPPDGGWQVVDLRLTADSLGLRSLLQRTSDHAVTAVTDIVTCEIDAAGLRATFAAALRLGMATLWAVSRDEAMMMEHLVGIGWGTPLPARTATCSSNCTSACNWSHSPPLGPIPARGTRILWPMPSA